MRKALCVILGAVVLLLVGCSDEPTFFPLEPNYTLLDCYRGEGDKFLGYNGSADDYNIIDRVLSLKDLSKDEYVLYQEVNLHGGPTEYIYMHKNAAEPMLRFDVTRIEILHNQETLTVSDPAVIEKLLTVCRADNAEKHDGYWATNATFHFDLECELTWRCEINLDLPNQINMIWYSEKDDCEYMSDVTDILSDVLK